MEQLGGRGEVDDLNVVLGAGLEEALEAGGGVLRSLTFVAVGEEERDAAAALPLRFATGDELVDHDLGAVGEVTELGFPDAEHFRVVERVAVIEAEYGRFGEQGIVDA